MKLSRSAVGLCVCFFSLLSYSLSIEALVYVRPASYVKWLFDFGQKIDEFNDGVYTNKKALEDSCTDFILLEGAYNYDIKDKNKEDNDHLHKVYQQFRVTPTLLENTYDFLLNGKLIKLTRKRITKALGRYTQALITSNAPKAATQPAKAAQQTATPPARAIQPTFVETHEDIEKQLD